MKNIFLCGFMGCGKSTVGKELANLLGLSFIDMDKYIEDAAGETVSEIFGKYGERRFREYEHSASVELAAKSGIVVGTGGGAVLSDENVKAMKSGGLIVFIDVPLNVIAERLNEDTTRPLLQGPAKADAMRVLYEQRLPVYRCASDIVVSNPNNSEAIETAKKIASNPRIIELLNC
ncbi:MAG TPA: shikimate kinase [Ruminiclostridium sp.]|nr:shikimate kinase [Ruminiclostridium sp.]